MRDPTDHFQRAAAHEAGHCVASLTYGIPIVAVTVEGSPHLHRAPWSAPRDFRVECLATLCLSRPAAEEMACGPITDGGDREDIAMARRCLLSRFSEFEVGREMVRMEEAARRLVRTPWAEVRVRRVADALMERRTLSGDDIYELISS